MAYPSAKPMSGINVATVRTSGMKITHTTSLTAIPVRMDRMTPETMRMPSPTCGGKGGSASAGAFELTLRHFGCLLPAESHFFHNRSIVGLVVVNQDADGTGHQGEDQSGHDASVWYGCLQVVDPSAKDVEQQRHHSQRSNAGAGRHDNAGIKSKKIR